MVHVQLLNDNAAGIAAVCRSISTLRIVVVSHQLADCGALTSSACQYGRSRRAVCIRASASSAWRRFSAIRINQSSTSGGPDLQTRGAPDVAPGRIDGTRRYGCTYECPKSLDHQTCLLPHSAGEKRDTEPGRDPGLHRRWLLTHVRSHGGIRVRSSRAGRRPGGRRLRPQSGA